MATGQALRDIRPNAGPTLAQARAMSQRFGRPRGMAAIVARAERVLKELPTVDDAQCMPWDSVGDRPLAVAPVEVRPWARSEAVVEAARRAAHSHRTVRTPLRRQPGERSPLFLTAIPIGSGALHALHGVMVLARRGDNVDNDDIELAEFLAERVARRWQADAEVAREAAQRKQMEALDAAALDVTSGLDLDVILERLVRAAAKLTGARYTGIGVTDDVQGVRLVAHGLTKKQLRLLQTSDEIRAGMLERIQTGVSISTPDPSVNPRTGKPWPAGVPHIRALLEVPVAANGETVGVLYLGNKRDAGGFSDDDEALLLQFARHAGTAILHARSYRAIARAHHRAAAVNRLAEFTHRMAPDHDSFTALSELLLDLSGVDAVSIAVFDTDGVLAARGAAGRLHPNPLAADAARALWARLHKLRSDDALTRELRATLQPVWMADLREDERLHSTVRQTLVAVGLHSAVSVPIVSAGSLKGIVEFASKDNNPIASPDLIEALATHVGAAALAAANMEDLHRAVRDIRELNRDTMLRMGLLCEARDPHTGLHLHSVSSTSEKIARELGLDPDWVDEIGSASVLHDVGKIRVPELLLLKPGPLTPDEWEIMRAHSIYGAELLDSERFHRVAREIARHHHERWDGGGYPDGLKGMRIPLSAQIVTVADCFDAMMSERPYKPAYSLDYALSEIRKHRETQFAPDAADAFLRLIERGEIDLHN